MLVWVPYGRTPGWDLPGGQGRDEEAACETAERETLEETGMRVRAVRPDVFGTGRVMGEVRLSMPSVDPPIGFRNRLSSDLGETHEAFARERSQRKRHRL